MFNSASHCAGLATLSSKILRAALVLAFLPMTNGCETDDEQLFMPRVEQDANVIVLEAGEDLETRAQKALIEAQPGNIIELPAGTFPFKGELSASVSNITLRGQGMDATILNFANQQSGGQGILATGDAFTIEDLTVKETAGDGIKIQGSNGVIVRRVRVGWDSVADENNGAYGVYPVQATNVLIEDSEVFGASDAGLYVGQSRNIIVRRNFVHGNVAGIEIENSTFADVYENETTENTGGILVFDLPNLEISGGERTRVFNNTIHANNTQNFAPAGNIVGTVPAGTGVMVMANDDIEIFGNTISDHKTVALVIVSYYIAGIAITDQTYDPIPEKIYAHDNTFSNNATDPEGLGADIASLFGVFMDPMPQIFYDSSRVEDDRLPEESRICLRDNGAITTGTFDAEDAINFVLDDLKYSVEPAFFDCAHPSLPAVTLDAPGSIASGNPDDQEAITKLCSAAGSGINAEAYAVNCPNLADYRLSVDPADPAGASNGGIKYDLTSPLFSDYAVKYREVFVPRGLKASYRSVESFEFPVGTIIAKTFAIKSDFRDPASAEEIIETRLLIHREAGWVGLPYIWNDGKTAARLTVVGGTQFISWVDANGEAQSTNYEIPNTNQCKNCHQQQDFRPIGTKARLLNKNFDYASGGENQIEHWTTAGILAGAPAVGTIESIPDWADTTAQLALRARGYLDINCAHCHNPNGAADTTGLFLESWRAVDSQYGLCKPPVAAGNAAGNLDYDILPGNAADSILVFRMDSNDAAIQMPELSRSMIHTEGVQLITDWINNMSPAGCP